MADCPDCGTHLEADDDRCPNCNDLPELLDSSSQTSARAPAPAKAFDPAPAHASDETCGGTPASSPPDPSALSRSILTPWKPARSLTTSLAESISGSRAGTSPENSGGEDGASGEAGKEINGEDGVNRDNGDQGNHGEDENGEIDKLNLKELGQKDHEAEDRGDLAEAGKGDDDDGPDLGPGPGETSVQQGTPEPLLEDGADGAKDVKGDDSGDSRDSRECDEGEEVQEDGTAMANPQTGVEGEAEAEAEKENETEAEPAVDGDTASEDEEATEPPGESESEPESVVDMASSLDPAPAPFRARPRRRLLARSQPIRVPVYRGPRPASPPQAPPISQDPREKVTREAAIAGYMGMDLGDGSDLYRGPQPWMVMMVVVVLILAGMGLLIALSDTGEGTPEVALASSRTGEFTYQVTVTRASPGALLEHFTYNLRDAFKLIYQTGQVGLQNTTKGWAGIDVTWADGSAHDTLKGNQQADRAATAGGPYEDPAQAQLRIEAVLQGGQDNATDQLGEGVISVSFVDVDGNGLLTAGDRFTVQSHSAYHPASDDHFLELVYEPEAKTVARTKLGTSKVFAPHLNLESIEDANNTYHVKVVDTTEPKNLTLFQFYLKDEGGTTQQFGEIEIQYLGNKWTGIDITWDDEGPHDPNPGNGMADRNLTAGKPYTDPGQAQARIDLVNAHNDSGRPLSVTFIDHDQNGKLTAGDEFIILGHSKDHPATDDFIFAIKFDLNYDTSGDTRLG